MTIALTRGRLAAVTMLLATLILDGNAEAITKTAYRYSTPITGYLSIPVAAFVSESSADAYAENAIVIQPAQIGTLCMDAPLNLPQGARMTAIAIWYINSGGTMQAQVIRQTLANGHGVQLAFAALADTAAAREQANVTIARTAQLIDNQRFNYELNICTQGTTANKIYGAQVTYTYTTAGD